MQFFLGALRVNTCQHIVKKVQKAAKGSATDGADDTVAWNWCTLDTQQEIFVRFVSKRSVIKVFKHKSVLKNIDKYDGIYNIDDITHLHIKLKYDKANILK